MNLGDICYPCYMNPKKNVDMIENGMKSDMLFLWSKMTRIGNEYKIWKYRAIFWNNLQISHNEVVFHNV